MTTAPPSWRFTLGLWGLDAEESARIRTLLTFARNHLRADWALGAPEESDVLLISHPARTAAPGPAQRPRVVVHLMEPGAAMPPGEALHKPLQYEPFATLLAHLEWTLIGLAALPSEHPPAPPPPKPARQREAPEARVERGPTFRLRRWPPAGVLAADRYHPRLASFLSTRAMGMEELSRLSGASLEHCQTFLDMVRPLGIMETVERAAAPKRPADAPAPEKKSKAPGSHGLIALIRQHLGIGGSH